MADEIKIERTIKTSLSGEGKGRGGEVKLKSATVLGWSNDQVSVHFYSKRPCKDGTAYVRMSQDEALALARSILYASGLPHTIMLSRKQGADGGIVVESFSADGVVGKEEDDGETLR